MGCRALTRRLFLVPKHTWLPQVRHDHVLVYVVEFLDEDGKALPRCFALRATHGVSDGVGVEYALAVQLLMSCSHTGTAVQL